MADNITLPVGVVATKEGPGGAQSQRILIQALQTGGGGALIDLLASVANGLQVDVTRVQGSVAVTGPVTNAQLIAAILSVVEPPMATVTNVAVAASAVAVDLAAAISSGTNRRALRIYNNSDKSLYVREGAVATLTAWTVKLGPGDYWEMPGPPHNLRVSGIWEAAPTGNAQVTEGRG